MNPSNPPRLQATPGPTANVLRVTRASYEVVRDTLAAYHGPDGAETILREYVEELMIEWACTSYELI